MFCKEKNKRADSFRRQPSLKKTPGKIWVHPHRAHLIIRHVGEHTYSMLWRVMPAPQPSRTLVEEKK